MGRLRNNISSFNNKRVFSLICTHLKDMKNGKKLIIDSNTGSWAFISKEYFPLLKLIDGKHVGKKIVSYFSDKVKADEVLEMLWSSGVLALDGKQIVQKDNFRYPSDPNYAVLNVTKDCNFRCSYCYANGGISSECMSPDIMERITSELLKLPTKAIHITFHGGEPLINFKNLVEGYNKIKAIKTRKTVGLSIQTNATLINDEIADFLKEAHIAVGVSLDGFLKYNDLNRFYRNGRGTFNNIMKGISVLRKKNIHFGVLTILTQNNIEHIEEIFDFFIKEGIYKIAVDPFFPLGRGVKYKGLSITSDKLFQAMKFICSKIYNYNKKINNKNIKLHERNISYFIQNIVFSEKRYMCKRSPCGAGLSVLGYDVNGDVYTCDDFVGIPEFFLGNIMKTGLGDILYKNKIIERFKYRTVNNVKGCATCEWKYICCGGCPSKVYGIHGIIEDKDLYCDYYKKMISYLMDLISQDRLETEYFIS